MHIESLKTWHWLVIGAIVGLAVGALRTQTTLSTPLDSRAGLPLAEFADLAAASSSPARPALRDVTVYPAVDGRNFVTGEYLRSAGFFSAGQYVPFQLNTPVPFRLPRAPRAPSPDYTVRDYLARVNPSLPYTYAWYASDGAQFLLCTAAATLLIGGLWPVVLRLLIGAGYGRKVPAEPAYDLDRFSRAGDETPAAPPVASAEEVARLGTLTQTLESQLAATATGATAHPSAPDQPIPAVAMLSNTPYNPDLPVDPSEGPKDYKGEFYPVARAAQKHDA